MMTADERGPVEPNQLPYPAIDADNHYYEALDAFTRHLDPRMADRAVRWVDVDGRRYHAVGGRITKVVTNPTFDPIALPGALCGYLRGNPEGRPVNDYLKEREPIRPEYRDPAARLEVARAQGMESVWLYPTLGVLYEELLKNDIPAVNATFWSFNRWMQEDWGFNHRDVVLTAPYISLADVDEAVKMLEWVLDHGARMICLRPAAPTTAIGQRSPTHTMFDPFWARVNEAGIPVIFHAGDAGYRGNGYNENELTLDFAGSPLGLALQIATIERAITDMLTALIIDKLFHRFPNIRVASVENGAGFVPALLKTLKSLGGKLTGHFPEDPAETFRRHVWINPFWEDDVDVLLEAMGPDRIIFGSDWPHVEGLQHPLDYLTEIKHLDESLQRRIMHDNAAQLLGAGGSAA